MGPPIKLWKKSLYMPLWKIHIKIWLLNPFLGLISIVIPDLSLNIISNDEFVFDFEVMSSQYILRVWCIGKKYDCCRNFQDYCFELDKIVNRCEWPLGVHICGSKIFFFFLYRINNITSIFDLKYCIIGSLGGVEKFNSKSRAI